MGYRDDLDAKKDRHGALAAELARVRAQMQRLDGLAGRARVLERELEQADAEVARARSRVTLPLLSNVKVASRCHESWEGMTGDERVRHCGRCDKLVYDLSAMTAEGAEALLGRHGASLCVRFYRRADGTVMTTDCGPGARRKRFRNVAVGAAAGLSLVGLGAGALATMGGPVMGEPAPTMGSVAVTEPCDLPVETPAPHFETSNAADEGPDS